MELNIDDLRKLCADDKIKWSRHALARLRERGISIRDFKKCSFIYAITAYYPKSDEWQTDMKTRRER